MKNLTAFPEPPIDDLDTPEVIDPPKRKKIDFREVMEDVFDAMGGTQGMVSWVKQNTANERVFYRDMLPKMFPKDTPPLVSVPGGSSGKLVFEWSGGAPDPAADQIERFATAQMIEIDSTDD